MSTITELPTEILEMILVKLKGTEAWACRGVCRRWRAVVDALPEAAWKQFCFRDFRDPTLAKKKCSLNYRDLYRSLYLWDRVEEAEVMEVDLPPDLNSKAIAIFQIIGSKIGIAIKRQQQMGNISDTIEYYSVETLELVACKHYPFLFSNYYENEKLITLRDLNRRLHIILKSNPDTEFIYNLFVSDYPNFTTILLENVVVFLNVHKRVCVSQLKAVDAKETIETRQLAEMTEYYSNIVAFAYVGRNTVNVMVTEYDQNPSTPKIKIYCVQEQIFQLSEQMSIRIENIAKKLMEYGFCWTDPEVNVIIDGYKFKEEWNCKTLKTAVCIHNHVVLLGTIFQRVHIFKKPYEDLMSRTKKPDKTLYIEVTKSEAILVIENDNDIGVRQLNVVEIINGHRVFVATENKLKLCIFDLVHNHQEEEKKNNKRKAAEDELSTSGKRKKTSTNREEFARACLFFEGIIPRTDSLL